MASAPPPVVSVLTPVYNGSRYLRECIESVLRQTFVDFEYLICDNRSTDESAAIAERCIAKDARARVVREAEFLDVHHNHNRALKAIHPQARYVKFVHADDWIYPRCLEEMVALAQAHPSVGLISSYRLAHREVVHDGFFDYTEEMKPGIEVLRQALLGGPWVSGSPSNLLLRADLVRARPEFYDGSVWHSDTDAAHRIMLDHDVGFVHQVLTFTRLHPGALTSFSDRVNSYLIFEGRMLARYGARVFTSGEYQSRMRRWMWRYLFWLSKQALKPSRRGQKEFHDFHRRQIAGLTGEVGDDLEWRAVLALCRRMLRS